MILSLKPTGFWDKGAPTEAHRGTAATYCVPKAVEDEEFRPVMPPSSSVEFLPNNSNSQHLLTTC